MKILFGIQGTGNGHISRSRIMASHFSRLGVDVEYLFSGRPSEQLFDMDCFGDFHYRRGLTFSTHKGRVNYLASAWNNKFARFVQDVNQLDLTAYDLVLTDFEPVTAWAARQQSVPVMGIGHQYAFGGNTPMTGENVFSKSVMKNFAPAAIGIGLHWHRFNPTILPPIIDTQLTKITTGKETVMVYLPFEDQYMVTTILRSLGDYHFIQYSPELVDSEKDNVSLRATNLDGFRHDLASASRVICNSGFELISECLHMGIPVLAKPVGGQMEQLSNALALRQLGYADVVSSIGKLSIRSWLDHRAAGVTMKLPDVAGEIVEWIMQGDWHDQAKLADRVWSQQNGVFASSNRSLIAA